MPRPLFASALLVGLAACAPALNPPRPSVDPEPATRPDMVLPPPPAARVEPERIAPPEVARANGLMALDATRVTEHARLHPEADGRGVLIAILDSGIDLGTAGLGTTSTGEPKVLDLRDFSGEGRIALAPLAPVGDTIVIGETRLGGFGRVRALSTGGPWYGGSLSELALGEMPGADLDDNGVNTDHLAVLVTRASDGWVLFADTDRDGTLEDEQAWRDYATGRETFGWHRPGLPAPITIAVNLADGAASGPPVLDLFFDQSSHGTHVAGIAAGHRMFGLQGYDGVAPGANLLGVKISNNALGGISVTGSIQQGIDYAIRFAQRRNLPLVINLSFGVGNEAEGAARIDAIIDSVLAANPGVVFATSAGNDGPGLSTQGFPATARRPISVGATWPAVFSGDPDPRHDLIAFFSSRGGETAKPDLVAPGFAYATVPRYNTGDEIKNGTSMASPHVAGLAARLVSSRPGGQWPTARSIKQALMVTARPFEGALYPDQGTGQADLVAAQQWLAAGHPVEDVLVEVTGTRHTAAWRGEGLRSPADTTERFTVTRPAGSAAASFRLRSSTPWLRAPATATIAASGQVAVSWNPAALTVPGTYSGVVSGWTADTTAGPAFRLVTTIVVPEPGVAQPVRRTVTPVGGAGRVFFQADSARPFDVRVSTTSPQRMLFASFFEPGGQPLRTESFLPAGFGEEAAEFSVDGRDAVRGTWQAAVAARVGEAGPAVVEVFHSPVRLSAVRQGDSVTVTVANLEAPPVNGELYAGVIGGERGLALTGQGGAIRRVPLQVPEWATRVVVDITMPRQDWPRFTDFGTALVGGDGQIIESAPLNYHTVRLASDLEPGPGGDAELVFLPGFANPGSSEPWQLAVTVRFYAGQPQLFAQAEGIAVTIGSGASAVRRFSLGTLPWVLPSGFAPLGQVAMVVGDRIWTREVNLSPPMMAVRP